MEAKQKKQSSIMIYLKNLSKKDKIILSSTIIVVSLVFGLKFLILPQLEQYTNNLLTLDMKREEQSRISMIPAQNKILEEKQEELKEQYDLALEEISKTPAVAQIIYDLKALMITSGVEIKSLSFSSSDVSEEDIASSDGVITDENGVVTEIDRGLDIGSSQEESSQTESEQAVEKQIVNISLSGEYENIIKFIKSIENYSRISDVSDISLSTGEGSLLNANLTANFYNLNYNERENYDFNDGTYGKENSFN
ncbi:type 4a pilus biogenesis protein PilO [Clostridium saudiense]|uniref:Type 4a pilus biogenesis protein PilO n=1 Tax=Clostridium saudiense TaxID=1414720 RepID=A0ABS2FBZ4_9CLOT|nr:type 4a pilus biogenesis protein PilO [Clostridium saudiense]MBM6818018.1 type 4a pilus biogenesis protein PilO [Clostridium saudiense]